MYTTQDEHGILNNFAIEPATYLAESPSPEQQRRYWIQGGVAIVFVASILGIALAVS